jgi:hypothetical protein
MKLITIPSVIVYCLSFFAFPWFTIGNGEHYLYILMSYGNLDFLCIPLLIGAAVMGSRSSIVRSSIVISIILGVIGLGMAGNRFIAITSSDLGGIAALGVGLGMYLVIGFAIINIYAQIVKLSIIAVATLND